MRKLLLLSLILVIGCQPDKPRSCDLCDEPCFSGPVPQKYKQAWIKGKSHDPSD